MKKFKTDSTVVDVKEFWAPEHAAIDQSAPERSIIFYDGDPSKEVGKLFWDGDEIHFTGDADESAKVFFKSLIDLWKGETKDERIHS
ncbi:MAG: hypothetical protein J7J52_04915 [Deltaproteobacteria bacterium]|nr:hypothetical protein [Deltaproteobacteria bacterium]